MQMPDHSRRDLQTGYHANAASNAIIYQELARILATTRDPGIPIVVLKGTALAATTYANWALRPLSDIDLLLHRRDLEPVMAALKALRYREAYPGRDTDLDPILGYDVHLRGGPNDRVIVDLHWKLIGGDADWRAPSTQWFWEETQAWERENEQRGEGRQRTPTVFQLTPTAQLLYSAAHLTLQHGGASARLIWYYDLHLLLTRQRSHLDWEQLLARAREFRWTAALLAALRGAQERFGTPLPIELLDTLEQAQDQRSARIVARKASAVQSRTTATRDKFTSLTWPARLRLAWSIAFPSPTYMRWRYEPRPTWLWPLYYPYRWFDIARDSLSTLWQIANDRQ